MKLSKKLYKVTFGLLDNGAEFKNWSSKNIVARDAIEAVRKAKSGHKNSYVAEVQIIDLIDKL